MKAAVFSGGEIIGRWCADDFGSDELEDILAEHQGIMRAIISSTRDDITFAERITDERIATVLHFNPTVRTTLKNLYYTPATLGSDRLAAAVGANKLFPGRNLMVVDFGTALTTDVVTAAGEYLGGNIAPGVSTRFRALSHFTGRLPLVAMPEEGQPHGATDPDGLIGKDTPGAISAGVLNGIVFELEGYMRTLGEKFDDLAVIFTGGEADYFAEKFKSTIFANYDLVLIGLNTILEYNAGKE